MLNDEVGIEDNLEGISPFKYAESSSRGRGQAIKATYSKTKSTEKKISSTCGSSSWVFKQNPSRISPILMRLMLAVKR